MRNPCFKKSRFFQHEIFHCIEIEILLSSNALTDDWNVFKEDFHVNTTRKSIKLWSEFYACYNNFKINFWHEIPNIEIDIKSMHKKRHYDYFFCSVFILSSNFINLFCFFIGVYVISILSKSLVFSIINSFIFCELSFTISVSLSNFW